jgi:hypothetical protein
LIGNTGVSKYRTSESSVEDTDTIFSSARTQEARVRTIGGYDGGCAVGFSGNWEESSFLAVTDQLACARESGESAESRNPDESYIALGDRIWHVKPHGTGGGRKGPHYKYILEGNGIKVYIHHNAHGHIQPVRVQYGFESLIGQDLFTVHRDFRCWLASIGFHVTEEKISRADLQVTIQRDPKEIFDLIEDSSRLVMAPRKDSLHRRRGKSADIETYTAGSISSVQICIYDKKQELLTTRDELKTRLLAREFFGMDLPENCSRAASFIWDNLTRIEFRIGRSRLKELEIHTVQDLQEKQESLVSYLTFCFFRILETPKIRGHENTQTVHPVWRNVIELFAVHFRTSGEKKEICRGRDKCIRCTCDDLVAQAMGCFSTAVALVEGTGATALTAVRYIMEKVNERSSSLLMRALDRAREFGIVRGHDPSLYDPETAMEYDRELLIESWRSSEQPIGVPF